MGGPAGAGKSTVLRELLGTIDEIVALESDVLWREEYGSAHEEFRRTWLRLASQIARSGRPVAIFGAGFAVPHNVEPLPERADFGAVHYLALTCDDDVLAARIRRRKPPRCTDDAHVAEHVDFNRWLRQNAARAQPPVSLIDTTHASIEEVAASVAAWIRSRV